MTAKTSMRVLSWVMLAVAVMTLLGSWYGYPSDPYGPPYFRGSRFLDGLSKLGLAAVLFVLSKRERKSTSNA